MNKKLVALISTLALCITTPLVANAIDVFTESTPNSTSSFTYRFTPVSTSHVQQGALYSENVHYNLDHTNAVNTNTFIVVIPANSGSGTLTAGSDIQKTSGLNATNGSIVDGSNAEKSISFSNLSSSRSYIVSGESERFNVSKGSYYRASFYSSSNNSSVTSLEATVSTSVKFYTPSSYK